MLQGGYVLILINHDQLRTMDTETLIAHHVEALIGLGWRWEGRGLIPGFRTAHHLTADDDQKLSQELINQPLPGQ